MDEIIKEYSGIAIILVICTVLLSTASYVGYQARDVSNRNSERVALSQELTAKRALYAYDKQTVNLDDILLTAKKYTKVYTLNIQLGRVGSSNWETLTEDDPDSRWNIDRLRALFGDDLSGVYESTLIRDISGGVVGFRFTRIG
jgi:CHASE3 domain sensor protein